jgi:hypothetical protein
MRQAEAGRGATVGRGILAPLLVFVLVALATRAPWFGDPVADFDEQIYSLIGWRMTHGDLPFVEIWDRKPFGLFAVFALAHGLFGPEPLAFQIFGCLAAIGGAMLVYLLAKPLVDRISAIVAGALYLMLMAAYGSYSGQSEIFHVPLMLAMLWLVRDPQSAGAAKRATLAMLLGGLALQIKYTVLPQCLFFGAFALYGEWRAGAALARLSQRAALFALLGVLPTALVALLYYSTGHFDAFWFANFVSFFDRTPAPGGRLNPDLLSATVPLALMIALGLYGAFRLSPPRDWRIYGLYVGWGLATLATVLLPATVYIYYFGAMVPSAVLIALPFVDRKTPAKLFPAALLLLGAGYDLDYARRYAHSYNERRTEARLSAAIGPYVGPSRNCLYVFDGPAALYRTTGTCLPTRFAYPDHLNNALEARSLEVDQPTEISRILAERPGVIVTADRPMTVQRKDNLELIRKATATGYRPLITASLHNREVTAWVRSDLDRR